MPKNRTLSILFSPLTYAGNSTSTALSWPTAEWLIKTLVRLKTEEKFTSRIHEIILLPQCDTPVTLSRNAAVREARRAGCDLLVMLDSDMHPDVHVGEDPHAVPFIDAAFDRVYEKYDEGPRFVAAPYGGTWPVQNCFEFVWRRHNNDHNAAFELDQFHREEVMYLSGIQNAAAAPTGLIMYDMRCFDLIEPPYFRYEFTDAEEWKKASTEDVQNTRDISLVGIQKLGYNPCEIAWSSWAGHLKNSCTKKPQEFTAEMVSKSLARALQRPSLGDGRKVQLENVLGPATERLFASLGTPVLQATDSRAVEVAHVP